MTTQTGLIWTADGWAGELVIWLASATPHRDLPWTADGWIGFFGHNPQKRIPLVPPLPKYGRPKIYG